MGTLVLGLGATVALASLPLLQSAGEADALGGVQQSSATAQPPAGLLPTNLGISVAEFSAGGHWAAFTVWEPSEGGVDLNGDGDVLDHVLHVLDLESGVVKNIRLAVSNVMVLKDVVTFNVREGDSDLNGDGDTLDKVAHLLRLGTNEVVNLGLARSFILSAEGHWCVFRVSEQAQGRDLNRDGDMGDAPLHMHDVRTNSVRNLGLTTRSLGKVEQSGPVAAFLVSERSVDSPDLNGDGDELDDILFVHDYQNNTTINVGLAAEPTLLNFNRRLVVDEGVVAMSVHETAQGATDLNGDGDAADIVLHAFEVQTRRVHNTGLSPIGTPAYQDPAATFILADARLGFLVDEDAQGQSDLDGNGFATENVPHVYDLRTQQSVNVGIAANFNAESLGPNLGFDGSFLAFMGPHATLGCSLHVYDVLNGATFDTQLIDGIRVQVKDGLVAQLTPETVSDLNGDGDQDDLVQTLVEGATGATQFTVASSIAMTIAAPLGYTLATELGEGATDLNGDGDTADRVIVTHSLATGAVTNTGLAAPNNWGGRIALVGQDLLVHVSESSQGGDLNGDGDELDHVLHLVRVGH
jgi:hypothetical protein